MEILVVAVVGLLTIAFTTSLAPRLRIAAPLVLVILGLAVSLIPAVPEVTLNPDVVLEGILPPLLYATAVSTPTMDFRRDFRLIGGMSVLLVAVSAVALGFLFTALIPGLPLAAGIALGAIVSPTDAVATSIVREVGVSPRITSVLEGESLLNDATALVLLRSAVAVALVGQREAGQVLGDFVWSVAVAVVIGAVVGRLNLLVRARVSDASANTVLSFAVPFLASVPATLLNSSGLVAAVVAGLVTGHGAVHHIRPAHRAAEAVSWRTISLVLEGSVFLLMGLEMTAIVADLGGSSLAVTGLWVAFVGLVAVLGVRLVYVTAVLVSLNRRQRRSGDLRERLTAIDSRLTELEEAAAREPHEDDRHRRGPRSFASMRLRVTRKQYDLDYFDAAPFGWREGGVLTWAGMRGVVTVVAAQTLPTSVPHRSLLVFVAFVVAASSLLLQGGTLGLVVRLLRPARVSPEDLAAENERLDRHLRAAAFAALTEAADPEVAEQIRRQVGRIARPESAAPSRARVQEVRLHMIEAQRESLVQARDAGAFSSGTLTHALAALDAQQIALEMQREADVREAEEETGEAPEDVPDDGAAPDGELSDGEARDGELPDGGLPGGGLPGGGLPGGGLPGGGLPGGAAQDLAALDDPERTT
ncbi:sodium:proton antiporter [Miniimonas sp. S16]|uniref:cation:proton antiporter n=1 Tax=Miniimonas sp. S16 TaxID=2171623 RepID=UPI000D525926|nr:sodium:proton antiporter [Miniimonas sp. S16]